MPNWCNNNISIVGNTETIKQLWEDANAEGSGLLNAMAPQPANIFQGNLGEKERQECAEQGIPNWYDWNVSNWGTKWDVSTEGLEFSDHGDGTASIQGWFDSAWAPPIGAYEKFCDDMDGVDLEASYYEPGMDFAGFWTRERGDEFMEDVTNYFRHTSVENWTSFEKSVEEEWNILEQIEMWDEECEDVEEEV